MEMNDRSFLLGMRMQSAKGLSTAAAVRREALAAIAAKGYAAVSMREIAERVGVGPGALYNHFATKQDILRSLMLDHLDDLMETWKRGGPAPRASADRLTEFVRFHLRYHFDRPDEVFVAYMELRSLSPENFQAVEERRQAYEALLRDILVAGQSAGEFAPGDPAVQARALIAMLTGVTTWYRPNGRLSRAEIEDIYLDMACRSVGLAGTASSPGLREGKACSMAG